MKAVCADCPMFAQCASFGASGSGVDGGFFAGMWLPWSSQSPDSKQIRSAVRRQLKVLAGGRPVGRPAKDPQA